MSSGPIGSELSRRTTAGAYRKTKRSKSAPSSSPISSMVRFTPVSRHQPQSPATPNGTGATVTSLPPGGPLRAAERQELLSWRNLIGKAKWVLDECMERSYKVEVADPAGNLTTIELPVKPETRTKAAIAVLAILARKGGGTIVDEAENEDMAESLGDLATRSLGQLRPKAVIEAKVSDGK